MSAAAVEHDYLDPAELREGTTEFARSEMRRTLRRRVLLPGCGCTIDSREPYRYHVSKVYGVAGLVQLYECDTCMRWGNRY